MMTLTKIEPQLRRQRGARRAGPAQGVSRSSEAELSIGAVATPSTPTEANKLAGNAPWSLLLLLLLVPLKLLLPLFLLPLPL
jgi:hypothetical protein